MLYVHHSLLTYLKSGVSPIFYYTGKSEIFNTDTCWGKISASHCPSYDMPSPEGINIKNTRPVNIEFQHPHRFEKALYKFHVLLGFLETIVGKPQEVINLHIGTKEQKERHSNLEIYCCMRPEYKTYLNKESPQPTDILINGGLTPDSFSLVLKKWLEKHSDRQDSRARFIQSFRKQNNYTIDRLVGAANMFDILPDNAVGSPEVLSPDLIQAIKDCKNSLQAAPNSQEKNNILGALGRVGKHNLKAKVKNRAKLITSQIDKFSDLNIVIDEAINCRNFYVHGASNKEKLTAEDRSYFNIFFTNTLEFIFAASELIEADWDIKKWLSEGSCLTHPFSLYAYNYSDYLQRLIEITRRKSK